MRRERVAGLSCQLGRLSTYNVVYLSLLLSSHGWIVGETARFVYQFGHFTPFLFRGKLSWQTAAYAHLDRQYSLSLVWRTARRS